MNQDLLDRSYAALLAGAKAASPSIDYDRNGYAHVWQENLANGLPLREIESDLKKGAGQELEEKICAAHSSASLAVNAFGPWRTTPAALTFAGISGFRSVRFEVTCPTGLGGTPPHLDLLADGDFPVAIESKCTEWMRPKVAMFSSSYDQLRPSRGQSPWFKQLEELREVPNRYQFLDAAQLIKHALGLVRRYESREIRLVYLYWEPRNHEKWIECRRHRAEADDLASKVQLSSVRLIPMSYSEVWVDRHRQGLSDHLRYLKTRYDLVA